MNLQGVQHSLSGHDDLFGLLLNGKASNKSRHFLSGLPLCQLSETFLSGPDARVDDFKEELSCSRVEDKDGAVDGLGSKISLVGLVDRHSVDICVIDKPNGLVGEKLTVVLRIEIRLGGFGGVQLEALPDSLPQHIDGGIRFHDLVHRLLQ